MSDFDLDSLHQLVDGALSPPAPVAVEIGRPGLGLGEGRLLSVLAQVLPRHLPGDVVTDVLGELRAELYQGLDIGSLPALRSVVNRCRRCPELSAPPWSGAGNMVDPDVVFITETPFDAEGLTRFSTMATRAGFSLTKVAVLGATRCRASSRRGASPDELARCADYWQQEVALLAPSLLVTMGSAVSSELLGPFKITDDHGKLFWLGPWPVLPTFSPAYAELRDQQAALDGDFAVAHRFVYGS